MYLEDNLKNLFKRASMTRYYQNLWDKQQKTAKTNFETLPLSDETLFDSIHLADFFAVSKSKISQCYFSSGTAGKPKMIPFTESDWRNRVRYREECYKFIGLNQNTRAAILLPFGPWIAGASAQIALMNIGSVVFPIGDICEKGEIFGLFKIIRKHNINTLITVPSVLQSILELAKKYKEPIQLNKIITSGEYMPDSLKNEAKKVFKAKTYSSYAASESFIGIECEANCGFHYDPKEIFVETVAQNTGEATEAVGLIVISVLSSDAVFLVRYNLRDLGLIHTSVCLCGSSLPRIEWKGRSHEVFVVSGAVNVYSYQIYNALANSPIQIHKCEIEITNRKKGRDLLFFKLFTRVFESEWPISLQKTLHNLITNMSIDLNDVVHCKFVKIETKIIFEDTPKRIKKVIRVTDNREYAR